LDPSPSELQFYIMETTVATRVLVYSKQLRTPTKKEAHETI